MSTIAPVTSVTPGTGRRFRRLILELSPKPFRDPSPAGTEAVARELLSQYHALLQSADALSFLFWTADGSEILDYRGRPDDEIHWARYIGIANDAPPGTLPGTLHGTARVPYCDNPPPPPLTYGRLRDIIATLRRSVAETTGKPVTFGTTFDPGPEFAESDFKYKRHPEINKGAIMGHKQWLHCASSLHADDTAYAGFPDGIPEGTPLGTFLGRQARLFMQDTGFDYIWFSNGFGFSLDSWNCTGEVFDGERFDTSGAPAVNRSILKFWQDFRAECPDHRVETRGSNLSTAMDLAAHASPVRDIYTGGFNLIAPVNSPWAALNHDYGLELVGWMSHIAELPGEKGGAGVPSASPGYPFRYYIHDPWWLNSPWLDRYGREPHDIYLPLACNRIGSDGAIVPPASLSLLTIDDSLGRLPREVPNEITPHIQRALADFPDAPGLLTWVYPFDEYHDQTFATPSRASEVFFGDWFMRTAVNTGLPLNTVVSAKNYLATRAAKPGLYAGTVLVTPAPDAGTPLAAALLEHIRTGGFLLLYGPLTHTSPELLSHLGLRTGAAPLDGELTLETVLAPDAHRDGSAFPQKLNYRSLLNGGPIDTDRADRGAGVPPATWHGHPAHDSGVARASSPCSAGVPPASVETLATVTGPAGDTRPFAVAACDGRLLWVRGALSETVKKGGAHLPNPDDPAQWAHPARLMRWALEKLGYIIRFDKSTPATKDPLILCARSRGGWVFSGFTTTTTTTLRWRFPQGVPVPTGTDVHLTGTGTVGETHTPAAWHRECRILVEQAGPGDVSCREHYSGEIGITRRLRISGLKNAIVTCLPDTDFPPDAVRIQKDEGYLGTGPAIPFRRTAEGYCITTEPVTGEIFCSW
ncbi:hypothetical protein OpiT1DRAFT_01565 [Opitutaceae bacterium TAV1]|nr:hypothetical protein OpiT1DRAFT_01565 [Opitutaceae bacterium TAV1]